MHTDPTSFTRSITSLKEYDRIDKHRYVSTEKYSFYHKIVFSYWLFIPRNGNHLGGCWFWSLSLQATFGRLHLYCFRTYRDTLATAGVAVKPWKGTYDVVAFFGRIQARSHIKDAGYMESFDPYCKPIVRRFFSE